MAYSDGRIWTGPQPRDLRSAVVGRAGQREKGGGVYNRGVTGGLAEIRRKVDAGQRLSLEDGLALMHSGDIWTIGQLADQVRRRLHGRWTYYNINRHVNYTNLCVLGCKFCSFYRRRGQAGVYELSVEEIARLARQAQEEGATEIHIVGGLHPHLPLSYYTDMLRAIRQAAPRLHIKAFTAVEIVHMARIDRRPEDIEGILRDLREAGLGSLPGGGAEVFDQRVHDQAFRGKIGADRWLQVHQTAHRLGLMSNATLLYGHIESPEDRIRHLLMLREAQDQAIRQGWPGRFQAMVPLPFIPDGSALEYLPGPTALESLKMLAVCRLMLDNIPHIKAFWVMQSLGLAQVALWFGVDDVDGTVSWYDITKLAGQGTHQEVSVAELRRIIREAGFEPVERDTLYRRVIREGKDWRVEEPVVAGV